MLEKRSKSKQNDWYRRIDLLGSGLFILISVGLAITYIVIASKRTLTPLEGTMLQFFILSFGLIASFVFGRHSAKQAGKELIKPHARSAFRRLIFLYQSLSKLIKAGHCNSTRKTRNFRSKWKYGFRETRSYSR